MPAQNLAGDKPRRTLDAPLGKTIFFMHIPKTAGTSVRHSAALYFGEDRALKLYGNQGKTTSPTLKVLFHEAWAGFNDAHKFQLLSDYLIQNEVPFFSSHKQLDLLPCFVPAQAFTILRDPVARVISHYHQHLKKYDHLPLETFIENPRFQNVQCRHLNKTALDQIGVVGLQDQYEETLRRVNWYFKIDLKASKKNTATLIAKVKNRFLSSALLQRIEQLNEKDMDLYEQAKKVFSDQS